MCGGWKSRSALLCSAVVAMWEEGTDSPAGDTVTQAPAGSDTKHHVGVKNQKRFFCHSSGSSTNCRACRNNTSSYSPARGHRGPSLFARDAWESHYHTHLENEQLCYRITPPLIQQQGETGRAPLSEVLLVLAAERASEKNQQCHYNCLKFQSQ